MNADRIINQTRIIAGRRKALAWLEEYGVKMTGRSEDYEAAFEVTLMLAGGVSGADEAAELVQSYARVHLPEIVNSAIACCRNDIASARDAIEAELASLDAPTP